MAKKQQGKEQIDKFRDAARELGCDESEEAFDEALKRLGKSTTRPNPKSKKPKRKATNGRGGLEPPSSRS